MHLTWRRASLAIVVFACFLSCVLSQEVEEALSQEHEGAEAAEEAEAGPSKVDVAIAATLISTISFVMYLYCFINYPDEDIEEMTWMTISRTISVFCAVLIFSSLNDLVDIYVITPSFGEGHSTLGALFVHCVVMLLFFAALQIVLAGVSGAEGCCCLAHNMWNRCGKVDMDEFEELSDEKQEDLMRKKKVNLACYGVLLAHIAGFSSISTFMSLQQQSFFAASWWRALLVPPIVLFFMLVLQRVTDTVRERVSTGDDGEKSVFEELWDEECEEAENEVMGFALSFTTVSALRFLITGCLPNEEGHEETCDVEEYLYHHTMLQKLAVMGMGFCFVLVMFVMRVSWPECLQAKRIKHMPQAQQTFLSILKRFCDGIYVACCMAFSWSFFYGFQMLFAGMSWIYGRLMLSFVLALALSFMCLALIIPLDRLADANFTGPKVDEAIRSIMSSLGLLIGFGWEQSFQESVWAIAMMTEESGDIPLNSHTTKFLLSVFCALMLVPAWKWYILTYIIAEGWEYQFSWKVEDIKQIVKKHIVSGDMDDINGLEEELDDDEDNQVIRAAALKRVKRMERVLRASGEITEKLKQELMMAQTVGKRVELEEDSQPLLPRTATPMPPAGWVPPPRGWVPPGWAPDNGPEPTWVPHVIWDPNLVNSYPTWIQSKELSREFQSRPPARNGIFPDSVSHDSRNSRWR